MKKYSDYEEKIQKIQGELEKKDDEIRSMKDSHATEVAILKKQIESLKRMTLTSTQPTNVSSRMAENSTEISASSSIRDRTEQQTTMDKKDDDSSNKIPPRPILSSTTSTSSKSILSDSNNNKKEDEKKEEIKKVEENSNAKGEIPFFISGQ
jgi:hypothetical protein